MAFVKICGLKTPETIAAAVDSGARYIGLNFYAKSPRYVSPEFAAELAIEIPPGVARVALTVNADDGFLDELTRVVPLDMLQLHGSESPDRVREVKARYGLPVIKAIGVATEEDMARVSEFDGVADQLLIDAKPAPGEMPGGTGWPSTGRSSPERRSNRHGSSPAG